MYCFAKTVVVVWTCIAVLLLLHIETAMVSAMGIPITRTKTKAVGIAGPQKTIRALCRYLKTAVIVCTPGDNGRCILSKELRMLHV